MIKYILSISISLFLSALSAQSEPLSPKKNSVYIELFGSSTLYYNLSYDRIIAINGSTKLSAALGIQYIPDTDVDGAFVSNFTTSPQINVLFGRKHHFELGLGATFPIGLGVVFPLRIGYRFQKKEGGFFFKAAFTPIYHPEGFFGSPFLPWGGISAGYTF